MPKFLKEVKLKQVSEDLTSEQALVLVNEEIRKRNLGDLYLKNVPVSIPGIFTAPNPITAANSSLSFSLVNQTQRHVFAGPTSANGTPAFRALESLDIADLASKYVRKAIDDTITANHNFTGTALTMSSNYYHNLFDGINAYVHYLPVAGNTNPTVAHFRVGIGGSNFRSFQINGNGNLLWNGTTLHLGGGGITSEALLFKIGNARTASGSSTIDLITSPAHPTYGLRIERASGGNSVSSIYHRGTAAFRVVLQEAARFEVHNSNTFRFVITDTGVVGIRETAPTRGTMELRQIADDLNSGIAIVNTDASSSIRMFVDSGAVARIWAGSAGIFPLYLNASGPVIAGGGTDTGDILQATGNINYTGLLKVSGTSGTDGQFLKRNATTNTWSNLSIADISNFGTSGSYIQNQIAAAQTADLWVSGTVRSTGGGQFSYGISTTTAAISAGFSRTADGAAQFSLFTDTLGTPTFRIFKSAGANGVTLIAARGTGGMNFNNSEFAGFRFLTSNALKVFISPNGNLILSASETDNGYKLSVDGDINYSTLLKVSGSSGANGQYLKRNSTTNEWATIDAGDITGLNVSNWNTAFSWGNHAGLYRSSSWVPSWSEVTGKPSTFAPSAHTHTVSEITDYVTDWNAKYNAKITGSTGVLPKFGASNTLVNSNIIESPSEIFLGWNLDYSSARIQTHLPVNIGSNVTNYNLLINEGNGQGMMLRGYVSGILQGELSFGSPAGGMQVNMPTGGNYQLSINGFPKYKLIANGHHHFGPIVSDNTYTVQISSGTTTGDGLHVQGNVATTGDFKAISDRRTKDHLESIKDPLGKMLQITGYMYLQYGKWKYGNVSQEVQSIMPHAVSYDKDGILMLNYNALSALYTEAIKELILKVKALEKEVETLNTAIK